MTALGMCKGGMNWRHSTNKIYQRQHRLKIIVETISSQIVPFASRKENSSDLKSSRCYDETSSTVEIISEATEEGRNREIVRAQRSSNLTITGGTIGPRKSPLTGD